MFQDTSLSLDVWVSHNGLKQMKKKGKGNIQWIDYIHEILLTYNDVMKHSATEMTPQEGRRPSNEFTVNLNLASKAKKNRMYPELEKGDEVKIFRERKPNEKERRGNRSQNKYTIERIDEELGQKYYFVNGMERAYLRFERLKIS